MRKRNERYGTTALCAALLAALLAAAALPATAFAADDGVYLAATNTYYLNPDTGVTDDGGSRNAAIGEGMCRSVIYEKALVEIAEGKIYVTVRMQLVSNMGEILFTVQRKAGDPASYAAASPRIIAEDAGADTADYRFSVPAVNSYIGCSTYVTPMGRAVKFYMNLSSDLTAGSADFVVSVKPKAAQADPAPATPADTAQADPAPAAEVDTTPADPTETPTEAEVAEATPESASPDEGAAAESAPAEVAAQAETTDAEGTAAASGAESAAEGAGAEAEAGDAARDEGIDVEAPDAADAAENGAEAGGGFPVLPAVVIAILVIAVILALFLLKRKK
ncbi:MAG: hypothetical protein LBD95_03725 [Clostridiales Family XIII bacterium]|jgi:hypothetical protein|nr:hypothetical protein [Clostridiales Family XIII bacterium]